MSDTAITTKSHSLNRTQCLEGIEVVYQSIIGIAQSFHPMTPVFRVHVISLGGQHPPTKGLCQMSNLTANDTVPDDAHGVAA